MHMYITVTVMNQSKLHDYCMYMYYENITQNSSYMYIYNMYMWLHYMYMYILLVCESSKVNSYNMTGRQSEWLTTRLTS